MVCPCPAELERDLLTTHTFCLLELVDKLLETQFLLSSSFKWCSNELSSGAVEVCCVWRLFACQPVLFITFFLVNA